MTSGQMCGAISAPKASKTGCVHASGRQQVARLERLIESAQANQWEPEVAIDWSLPILLPRLMRQRSYVSVLSQLYYSELATAEACRRLQDHPVDPVAHRFLAIQAADEMRHARVYQSYLQRLGEIAPIDAAVEAALEGALAWPGLAPGTASSWHLTWYSRARRSTCSESVRSCFPARC